MKRTSVKYFIIFILIALWVQYFFIQAYSGDTSFFVEILKVEWLIAYIYALFIALQYSGLISYYSIFLYLSFIFNYGRIFLDVFTSYELKYTDLFTRIVLTIDTEIELLQLIISVLLFSLLSFVTFYKRNQMQLTEDSFFVKVGAYTVVLTSIPLSVIYLDELKFVILHGYISIFNGELEKSSTLISTLLPRISFIGFMIFLSGMPKKELFLKISTLYLLITIFDSLKGQRGAVLLVFILLIWFYHKAYEVSFSIKKGIVIIAVALSMSQYLLITRATTETTIIDIPYAFLKSNGTSVSIPAYLIQFKEDLSSEGVPYFFAPVYDYFYRIFVDREVFYNGASSELLNTSNYLSYHLTNYINPDAFIFGNGTGTSYLGELYDLGGVFFSGFIMYIIVFLVIKWIALAEYKRYFWLLTPVLVQHFIYMPRGSLMNLIDHFFIFTVIYILFILLKKQGENK